MTNRILLTGTNRGIGRAIAKYFCDQGCKIVSLNRTLTNEKWLNEIECNLAETSVIASACSRAVEFLGGVDIVIFNAAVRKLDSIDEMSIEDWNESLQVNLSSIFQMSKLLIPELRKTKGYFFIMGSQAADYFFEGGVAYCCSKAALKAFAEVLLMENREFGVRVSILHAGAVKNRPKPNDDWKIEAESIGKLVFKLVNLDPDLFVSQLEVRPTEIPEPPIRGIGRIQSI